jgi:UDP-glucose:(heptosyl)LPS alpha-1,3-glucosyltransferase
LGEVALRNKLAVIIPKYGLLGGAEKHTAELTNRISQCSKYDVHVFANKWTNQSENITFHKIPIFTFPKFLTTISFAFFSMIKLSRGNFDIVHTHERIFSADVCTLHGIPHHLWVKDVRKKKVPSLFDYGTMWVARKFINSNKHAKFVAVSSLTKEKFLEEYADVDPGEVSVIHPGVDTERFTQLDRRICRSEVRQRFGIGEEDIVIIFVSMNYDIKGLDYLMAGLARFKEKYPGKNFKLLVVGKSDSRKYISLAKKTGIQHNVIYTGAIPHDQIPALYVASDVFSMLSRFDTFGLTVLEAMASSLPVIISGSVGAKDIVKEGVNGFVIGNPEEADRVADAFALLSDEDVRMKMSVEAYKAASSHRWEDAVESYLNIYDEVMREKASS